MYCARDSPHLQTKIDARSERGVELLAFGLIPITQMMTRIH